MEIKIFCSNCKEEILRADTNTLKTPLIGEMFQVKKDMEWAIFSPHDVDLDLICPMCEWCFHENGSVMASVNGSFVTGMPEMIIPGIVAHELNIEERLKELEGGVPLLIPLVEKTLEEVKEMYPIVTEPNIAEETNKTIETLQEPVNYTNPMSEEEKPEIPSNPIVESIESVPEKVPVKPEIPKLNTGDWNNTKNTNENSEMSGKAPPGTVATEPKPQKKAKKRRAWLRKHGK